MDDAREVPTVGAGSGPEDAAASSVETKPEVIIITGMSGAGRTEAMHTFEDLGYFCIDNLPPTLLLDLVSLAGAQTGSMRRLAVVCDLRMKDFFPQLLGEVKRLDDAGVSHTMLFLDASDESLVSRFSASRRRHPLCGDGMSVIEGIRLEREMLSEARSMANYVLDTSDDNPNELRAHIRGLFSDGRLSSIGLNVNVYSFGYKHGAPIDADDVVDVRFLPNPFYEPELRNLTGLDEAVSSYVLVRPETREFLARWYALLDVLMPGYVAEGKQHLVIAVGCTGGQHRSVTLAEATGRYLREKGYHVTVSHRDIALAEVGR